MKLHVSVVLAVAAFAILALPKPGAANLLVEGGFENNNLAPLGTIVAPILTPGLWGYEVASRVTSGNSGILPLTGQWMLEMTDDGLLYTQALQFVDITAYPTLQAGAYFNSDAPGAFAYLSLIYYASASDWGTDLGQDAHTLTLDSNSSTWESISFVSTRPMGATWVGIQVAFLNSTISPGHAGYVDDASLDPVPEPSSMLTLGASALAVSGMLFRRRRA